MIIYENTGIKGLFNINSYVYIRSGSPTKVLLRDCFIQVCIAGWILTFLYILYI